MQELHVVLQHLLRLLVGAWGILVELAHEHTVGGFRILVGTVRLEVVLHLPSAVELIGGGQVAALHLLEDGAGVDQTALREIEVHAGAQELLGQQGDVEVVGVEACEVAACELLAELGSQLLEDGLVLHVVIGDARQLCDDGLDGLLGVDELVAALFPPVGKHLDIGDLDDTVLHQIQTCGLQVEDHEGFSQIQFHLKF